jgi:hypothetical protein
MELLINEWAKENLDTEEAKTYTIGKLWEAEIERLFGLKSFPKAWHKTHLLPKKGNPCKSNTFRHCWKLRRELRGLIKTHEEMKLYITGNLTILKKWDSYVGINVLCGEKAYKRWKLYERWHREKENQMNTTPELVDINERKMAGYIDCTKKFIFEKCEGEPTKEKLDKFMEDRILSLWIEGDRICKHYLVLSPYMKDHLEELSDICNFDPKFYLHKITDNVQAYFKEEFAHEFESE